MGPRKIATTVYITSRQDELLKLLSAKTGVPMAEYIREGIDTVLRAKKNELPEQLLIPEMESHKEDKS